MPYRSKQPRPTNKTAAVLSILAVTLPTTMAQQSCLSLRGSTVCPAFGAASVSTNLTGDFTFLSLTPDVQTFDDRLRSYISSTYAQRQYQDVLGCSGLNLTNTVPLYARYTTSVLCNALIQASKEQCGLSADSATPLCAGACADFALSEQAIVSSPDLCGKPGSNAISQIRADFTRCSNPTEALSGRCIEAVTNENTECGYQANLQGLCAFCGTSSVNATDSCCLNANVNTRCVGVKLPTTVSMPPVFPTGTPSTLATSRPVAGSKNLSGSGLSGGAITAVVVGSIVGAALILAALIFCCIVLRRRRNIQQTVSVFNTPVHSRRQSPRHNDLPPMSHAVSGNSPPTALPGARVQRMSALEESTASSHSHSDRGGDVLTAFSNSPRDTYGSRGSVRGHRVAILPKRGGSLSSRSNFGSSTTSPRSDSDRARNFSSPDGVASGQSEQLQFFKDYYSQDDIHPNDAVATLWAYQPRAADEFELERGDMLKVVGIWDDGWATGVRLTETTEQWELRKAEQRDSGVSNGSKQSRVVSASEIKAFPLVCVCLPQHWRKTIEGDGVEGQQAVGGERSAPSP